MSRAVVIRKCATLSEAIVVRSLLEHGGFFATIDNYHYASIDWGMIAAFNGVAIRVPEDELLAAGEYMISAVHTAEERLEAATGAPDPRPLNTRRLKAWSMLLIFSGLADFILAPLLILIFWIVDAVMPENWLPIAGNDPNAVPEWILDSTDTYQIPELYMTETTYKSGSIFQFDVEGFLFVGIIFLFLVFEFAFLLGTSKTVDLEEMP